MKTLYLARTENVGEVDGMFDAEGNLLHYWFGNDATWRTEYFEPLMNRLGFTVECAPLDLIEALEGKVSEDTGTPIYRGEY